MINLHDAMAAIQTRRDDAIVLPTMTGGKGWAGVTQNRDLDLPVTGAMSKASSIGLGVALAQPDKRVEGTRPEGQENGVGGYDPG